jgi:hypothetical protein
MKPRTAWIVALLPHSGVGEQELLADKIHVGVFSNSNKIQ